MFQRESANVQNYLLDQERNHSKKRTYHDYDVINSISTFLMSNRTKVQLAINDLSDDLIFCQSD